MKNDQIKVYYDGLCVICSSEINHYKKMTGSHKIEFVDITHPAFDITQTNLDPKKIHKELHSMDADGKVHVGVETFILIWSQLNKLKWLSKLARVNLVYKILQVNYSLFVKVRPLLPRRSCENSPYCEIKK